jgi:hypothetical protein
MGARPGSAMAKRKKRKTKISHQAVATAAYKKRFLDKLAQGNSPRVAAELAEISHATIYNWRKDDAEFTTAWEEAIQAGVDRVETALVQRAIEKDTPAALAYLKAYRPELYARGEGQPRQQSNFILNITLQEHYKRLERLGLPVPVIESDLEDDDAPMRR